MPVQPRSRAIASAVAIRRVPTPVPLQGIGDDEIFDEHPVI